MKTKRLVITIVTLLAISCTAFAQNESVTTDAGTITKKNAGDGLPKQRPYSPYAERHFPARPFFGDTHLHTSFSMDAGVAGCRLTPRDAYRFARGEQVMASSGQPVKLSRPLDFLVVSDHSDNMGFFPDLLAGKPYMLANPKGRQWYDLIQAGKNAEAVFDLVNTFAQGKFPKEIMSLPGTPTYRGALHDMVANPRSATVMGLLEEARMARTRGQRAAQQAGSVKTLFGRAKDWFLGNF